MKVDLVYLWVDDKDPLWQEKRAKSADIKVVKESADDCRFKDNDELRYSLRSVEKFAPWINKIFVVTDNQVPSWLNRDCEKIRIVDHSEIIPNDKLPVFNSCVIENRVPFIGDLSEHFLLANDDTFFWNEVDENFFFDGGKTVFRVGKKIQNKEYHHLYGHSVHRAYQMIKDKFNVSVPYFPHHNIDAYEKSVALECIKEFQADFDETLNHKFRTPDDTQRVIVSFYATVKNKAVIRETAVNPLLKFLGLKNSESEYFGLKKSNLTKIKNSKAKLLCINDNRKTTDYDREMMVKILEEKFPTPSQFER